MANDTIPKIKLNILTEDLDGKQKFHVQFMKNFNGTIYPSTMNETTLGKESFVVQDVFYALKESGINFNRLIALNKYYGKNPENGVMVQNNIKQMINVIGTHDVLLASATGTTKYRDNEYYQAFDDSEIVEDEKRIPLTREMLHEAIDSESKMLESLGFISINSYVQYEDSVPYVYNNMPGRTLVAYLMYNAGENTGVVDNDNDNSMYQ